MQVPDVMSSLDGSCLMFKRTLQMGRGEEELRTSEGESCRSMNPLVRLRGTMRNRVYAETMRCLNYIRPHSRYA